MKYATLTQKDAENSFSLDGNTVIGRKPGSSDEVIFDLWRRRLAGVENYVGKKPDNFSFDDLQRFYHKRTLDLIVTDGPLLSRRHLIFCLPEEKVEGYHIVDLFSLNGTVVNQELLNPGVPRILNHGDIITLPVENGRKVDFIFKEIEKVTTYDGLMIANPDGTLPIDESEGVKLKTVLEARGFNFELLINNVRKEELLQAIDKKAGTLEKNSYFLFAYLGHGSKEGELVLQDGKLPVRELYSKLENIRAKKILIFDCCYGREYLQNIPPNSAVAVSTRKQDIAYAGIFMKGMRDVLKSNTQGFYLEDLISRVCTEQEYFLNIRGMEPGMVASSEVYIRTGLPQEQEHYNRVYNSFKHREKAA